MSYHSQTEYDLAVMAMRETGIRAGRFTPINERERRQADEGPRRSKELDCIREEVCQGEENG